MYMFISTVLTVQNFSLGFMHIQFGLSHKTQILNCIDDKIIPCYNTRYVTKILRYVLSVLALSRIWIWNQRP